MTDAAIPSNFKTSLPARKRAKTKEEKEQRRIERILRNRKAAHASREKKRKHVEFLETYVLDLEKQMHLVKQLNDKLLSSYNKGDNAEVDLLRAKISALPDLNTKKAQHATELDSVGYEDEEEEEDEEQHELQHKQRTEQQITSNNSPFPKTPESFASSPKSNDVPELDDSRDSMSSQSSEAGSYTPPFLSQHSSPVTMDKFSLDISTAEPTFADSSMNTNNDVFIKRETIDDFLPQIPQMDSVTLTEKLNVDEFQVKLEDNDFMFDELRNPAVIATDETTMTIGWCSQHHHVSSEIIWISPLARFVSYCVQMDLRIR
ncbi:CYFA0S18e00716g1_1 [Cyberlindnera fabianii]|uniref:CYFA0S18e00716g1_1 n=1 Tax=Cyberlindnera fabianii TaxID=36022 RepID=A0A061BEK8_CYBFA|nr:CYFA0S18e00716g1_1 [Cyberlindnera fabianii]